MAYKSKIITRRNNTINEVDNIVFRGISAVVNAEGNGGFWKGTMSELMTALNRVSSKRQRTILPGSPGALRIVINRVANRIRNRGIGVRFGRTTDHARTRFVRFTQ